MLKKNRDKTLLAVELILEGGMSSSAVADIVGETPETVEKWLVAYNAEQAVKLRSYDAELIDLQKRVAENQEELAIHRATCDLIMDHPDLELEKLAKMNWETISERGRHKIITNAFCIDCGATIITECVMQGDEDGIRLFGKCGKCGKSMATRVEL